MIFFEEFETRAEATIKVFEWIKVFFLIAKGFSLASGIKRRSSLKNERSVLNCVSTFCGELQKAFSTEMNFLISSKLPHFYRGLWIVTSGGKLMVERLCSREELCQVAL